MTDKAAIRDAKLAFESAVRDAKQSLEDAKPAFESDADDDNIMIAKLNAVLQALHIV